MRGPGWSEDWRRPGSGSGSESGSEMPVRKVGSGVEGFFEGVSTACGRLARSQLVYACAGNPVPLSKVLGQVPTAFNFVCGALEQGDQQFPVLYTDAGRASNEPEAIDLELGLRQSALSNEPEALRKIRPKIQTLPKMDGGRRTVKGRPRQTVPASWRTLVIDTEPEYSYDPVADIHSFNPLNTFIERPTRGRSREKSTIIVQNARGITTIPVYNSVKASTTSWSCTALGRRRRSCRCTD